VICALTKISCLWDPQCDLCWHC